MAADIAARIINLPLKSVLDGSEYFPLTDGATKRTTAEAISDLAAAANSGTYTPTLTNVANAPTLGAHLSQWLRVGDTVTVSGKFDYTATVANTLTQVGMSLPVPSNITQLSNLGGTGTASGSGITEMRAARISGDATNDRAEVRFYAAAAGIPDSLYFTLTYRIQ